MRIFKLKTQYRSSYDCAQYKCILDDNIVVYVYDDYSLLRIHTIEIPGIAYMNNMYNELSLDDPECKLISMLLI